MVWTINDLWTFLKIVVAYSNRLSYVRAMNRAAQQLGRLGGKAGRGKCKARKVTSDQARAAVLVRWTKPGARKRALRETPTLEEEFNKFAAEWKADIGPESTIFRTVAHPAYLGIIALGDGVIPFILDDLQKQPNHWFPALRALAHNFSPVKPEDAGNIKKMTKAWLKWGRDNGKIV
jgi:hypothetical protein